MCVSIMRADQRVSLLTIDAIAAGHSGDYTSRATNNAASVTLSHGHFGCKRFVIKSHVTLRISLAALSIF